MMADGGHELHLPLVMYERRGAFPFVREQMFAALRYPLVSTASPACQRAIKCLMMVDVDHCLLLVLIKYLVGSERCI